MIMCVCVLWEGELVGRHTRDNNYDCQLLPPPPLKCRIVYIPFFPSHKCSFASCLITRRSHVFRDQHVYTLTAHSLGTAARPVHPCEQVSICGGGCAISGFMDRKCLWRTRDTTTETATACDTTGGISVAHRTSSMRRHATSSTSQPASHPNSCAPRARCGFRLCDDCDDNLTWHNTQARPNNLHSALHPRVESINENN